MYKVICQTCRINNIHLLKWSPLGTPELVTTLSRVERSNVYRSLVSLEEGEGMGGNRIYRAISGHL